MESAFRTVLTKCHSDWRVPLRTAASACRFTTEVLRTIKHHLYIRSSGLSNHEMWWVKMYIYIRSTLAKWPVWNIAIDHRCSAKTSCSYKFPGAERTNCEGWTLVRIWTLAGGWTLLGWWTRAPGRMRSYSVTDLMIRCLDILTVVCSYLPLQNSSDCCIAGWVITSLLPIGYLVSSDLVIWTGQI